MVRYLNLHHGQPPWSHHCQPWLTMVDNAKPWYHGQPETGGRSQLKWLASRWTVKNHIEKNCVYNMLRPLIVVASEMSKGCWVWECRKHAGDNRGLLPSPTSAGQWTSYCKNETVFSGDMAAEVKKIHSHAWLSSPRSKNDSRSRSSLLPHLPNQASSPVQNDWVLM